MSGVGPALGVLAERLTFDNPWVVAVDAAPRRVVPSVLLLLALGVAGAAVEVGRLAGPQVAGLLRLDGALLGRQAVLDICIFAPLWAAALVGGGFERRAVWRKGSGAPDAAAGLVFGAGLYVLAVALLKLTGHLAQGPDGGGGAALGGVAAGLALTAFQAGAEEAVFRGWLQPVLCARWGVWCGLLAASAVFAALHLVAGERSPMALLNLMLGGMAFGLLALRSGGLWAPFAAHIAWNWIESGVLGLEPNPGVGAGGSIWDLDIVGAGLWSGGGDAMNGSLAATLVLLLGVAGLALSSRVRGR